MRAQRLFINGTWIDGHDRAVVRNPWNNEVVGTVAVAGVDQARTAVAAASSAWEAGLPAHQRAQILQDTGEVVSREAEEFAQMLCAEAGKPITSARQEVRRAIGTLQFSAEEARRLPGETVQLDAVPSGEGRTAFTLPRPIGVVAAVTPFNFPLNLVVHKVGPAIAAGCPVVLKPSERTPLTAGLLVAAFEEAGLPAGWLNLVTGDPAAIVTAWQEDPRVAVLTFTGSAEVGWKLKAASPRKRHVLELGANTAMVIRADADLDRAVDAAVSSAFAYAGQTCVSLQRLYVEEAVVEETLARLAAAATALASGDPSAEDTVVGPLITTQATDRVRRWLAEAVAAGARIVAGGALTNGVLAATVVTDVPDDSPLLREEVFGPVVTVIPVSDLDAAIAAINDSRFGLNASVYTSDLAGALTFSRRTSAGTVLVNVPPGYRADHMPYGGVKDSGQGREGVRYAVAELSQPKLVILAG